MRRLLLELGLPTFGLAFAISVLTTYAPVVLIRLVGSTSQVGALLGAEGAFALAIPLLSGAVSDRLPGPPAMQRFPFVVLGAPLVVAGLLLVPLGGSTGLATLGVLTFFIGYYLYYPPYRALYADLLPRDAFARAQSGQAVLRGAGLGAALLTGGLLLSFWEPLPFVLASVAVVVTTLALVPVEHVARLRHSGVQAAERISLRRLLFRTANVRAFALANACWEFSFAGLKTFIVLYVVRGLGHSAAVASAVIAVVAVAYIVGAVLAGRLADAFGIVRVLRVGATVYGAGLLAGTLFHTLTPVLVGLPFIALAGAIVMTLPQALAFTIIPQASAGSAAGIVDFSRGVGVVLGPVVVGAAIAAFPGLFPATHGYAAMWPVIAVPVLASVLVLRPLEACADASPAAAT
jgi:MFS family permease